MTSVRSTKLLALVALLLAAGLTGTVDEVQGGTIGSLGVATGPGLGAVGGDGVVTGLAGANNDNVSTDPNPNTVSITKGFGAAGVIDLPIVVLNSGGTTEYRVTERVTNNTAVKWTDYHFALGYGTGVNFVESGLPDFVDFDAPDRDPTFTSDSFGSSTLLANSLDWFGLPGVLPGALVVFAFGLDLPDTTDIPAAAHILDLAGVPVGYVLTLRQFPTSPGNGGAVPEPASLLLLGAGLAGLGVLGWRRRRS